MRTQRRIPPADGGIAPQATTESPVSGWRFFLFSLYIRKVPYAKNGQPAKKNGIWGIIKPSTKSDSEKGGQIDMVISRADRAINLCEMKFALGKRYFPLYIRQPPYDIYSERFLRRPLWHNPKSTPPRMARYLSITSAKRKLFRTTRTARTQRRGVSKKVSVVG